LGKHLLAQLISLDKIAALLPRRREDRRARRRWVNRSKICESKIKNYHT